MAGLLHGKVSLITNATSNLGKAVASRISSSGSKIFLTDPNENKLQNTISEFQKIGIEAVGCIADLNEKNQRKELFKEVEKTFGGLDAFIIYPGQNHIRGNIIDSTSEEFQQVYSQYLTVPFMLCKESLPLLKKSKGSSIVLLTSMAGFTPFYDIGLYSSAQTGMLGLCKALAQSLARDNIRVNAVATGMLTDDGTNGLWTLGDKCANDSLSPMIPLQRIGNANDIGTTVEFLASDRASYITGETLVVSGGINVRL